MKKLTLIMSLTTFAIGFFAGHLSTTSTAGTTATEILQISPSELMTKVKDLPDATVREPF